MKIHHFLLIGLSALFVFVLSSCVDNDYDLSDIDTMARFKTKNLVVPLNLDVITLDQVMDLDEDSEIKKVDDPNNPGQFIYAIEKEGDFTSDPIKVDGFTISKPHIDPITSELEQETPSVLPPGISARYPITCDPTSFESTAENIDKSIKSIESVGVNTKFTIDIKTDRLGSYLSHVYFTGVKIQFPEGLTATPSTPEGAVFDACTGLLTLPEMQPDSRGRCSVILNITAIDGQKPNITYNSTNHTLIYKDNVQITAGEVEIRDIDASFPNKINFTSSPTLDAIKILTFTGQVEYDVEDFNIDPIDLSNVPDIINQPGTKLMLEKPQLFLEINNPVAKYDVYFESGFELMPERKVKDESGAEQTIQKTYKIDANTFSTQTSDGSPQQANGNQFVLAPPIDNYQEEYYHPDYPNAKLVPFTALKRILLLDEKVEEEEVAETGVGIPTTINVNVKEPQIPTQRVADFVLGEEMEAVKGKYVFKAPLQLSENSHIAYTDTIDGWNDEDVDNITIDYLTINFDASTEIPFETELSIFPIDTTGEPIAGVETTTAHINAKAKNQPIEVKIIGPVTHLDGLLIKAHIINTESDTLSPDMKIYVNNTKATVTGHYDKEL